MFGIFIVRPDVDACDCSWEEVGGGGGDSTDTVKESALKVDTRRKIPCRTGDSNPRQYCALAFQSDALPTELFPFV